MTDQSDFNRIVAELSEPCIVIGCVYYDGHEGAHALPGEPPMTFLSTMHVGICAHCKQPVTEADSWTHDGPDMGGYPPTAPVYHTPCKVEALLLAAEKDLAP